MTEQAENADDDTDSAVIDLDRSERREVVERRAGSPRVIHEVIRLEGLSELKRTSTGLLASGTMAGVLICFSPITEAVLLSSLPGGARWADAVASLGYTTGFVIVILGNMQLFTESTVTAVLPIASAPSLSKLVALLRLWLIVFLSNMLGTLVVAGFVIGGTVLEPDHLDALLDLSRTMDAHGFARLLVLGIPSGALIGAVAWILPNAKGSEFWVVVIITWIIAAAGFSHCVAGSFEAWMLWLSGETSAFHAIAGMILPSLIGNIVGGTFLFAVLAHAQVHDEFS